MKVLAGDIGGTHARLAIVELDGRTVRVVRERTYASRDFPGLTPIVHAFLPNGGGAVERACFGIAGPVVDGVVSTSNLPWRVETARLAADIGITHTLLINDLTATALGVTRLTGDDLATVQVGEPDADGMRAVIAAGTGLGEAMLSRADGTWYTLPSEGGHGNFAPRSELEWDLFRSLAAAFGHVSSERVLSGPGLLNIYRFLAARPGARENDAVRAEVSRDGPVAITRHGMATTDLLCAQTLEVFAAAFGAEAGDLALTVLATGGVYVAGGIAPAILPRLREGPFLAAFRDKGRLGDMLSKIPVHVVMNTNVGLIGAAVAATDPGMLAGAATPAQPLSHETSGTP